MNINKLTTTITLTDVAKAISESMAANDSLGAFDEVEIIAIDTETEEVTINLTKKTKKPRKKAVKQTKVEEIPTKEG